MTHPQQNKFLEFDHTDDFQTNLYNESSFSSSRSSPSSFASFSNFLFSPNSFIKKKSIFRFKRKQSVHDRKLTGSRDRINGLSGPLDRLKFWVGSFSLMASRSELSVHATAVELRKQKINDQQKEELEREVYVLNKMLDHEQKVHEYLKQLQQRHDSSALTIPTFLPPKMKELLAELAMVENEITRLESQIEQLQAEVKSGKESSKSKEWERGKLHEALSLPPNPNNVINGRKYGEKVGFETKALHFISKAIKGDYNLNDFSPNEKVMMSSKGFLSRKEDTFFETDGGTSREKIISKRSGVLKPPSPLRDTRNPTPRRDRNLEIPMDIPQKVQSTPLHSEEDNIQRWPPNKLSENIMKCLIFIFIRLLRTSRAMELEKSGPIARSTNFSLSFRAETGSSSKTSLMFQKDSRQQDPYGIFDLEESVPRDIGPYKNLVRFTSSSMDLKCIQNSSSVPLFQKLKILMDGLQKVDLRFLSHQQKLAFWVNMYNACVMHGFLEHGVPAVSSPENQQSLINKATLNIAGNKISAQAIETFILRKLADSSIKEILGKADKDDREMILRDLYGLEAPDPNVTFALCCGTRSSPAVKIYKADSVIAELEKSKLEYLQAAIMVTSSKKIAIPELLSQNMHDFAGDMDSLMEWVCHQLPTSGSLRKAIVDCFRGVHHGSKASSVVEKIPYEFEFQYLLAM